MNERGVEDAIRICDVLKLLMVVVSFPLAFSALDALFDETEDTGWWLAVNWIFSISYAVAVGFLIYWFWTVSPCTDPFFIHKGNQ